MNELRLLPTKAPDRRLFQWNIQHAPPVIYSPIFRIYQHCLQFVIRNAQLFVECATRLDAVTIITFSDIVVQLNGYKGKKIRDAELVFNKKRGYLMALNLEVENVLFLSFKVLDRSISTPFIGFPNTSVYCYMNSLLQLIFFDQSLRQMLCSFNGKISTEMRRIYHYMQCKDELHQVDNQYLPVTKDLMAYMRLGDYQEDATEFFYKLVYAVEEQLSDDEKEKFSDLESQCYIEQTQLLESTESAYTSTTLSHEFILRVPVLGYKNLQQSILSLQKPICFEKLININGRYENAARTNSFKFGRIIMVYPERIVFNTTTFVPEKILQKYVFPEYLRVGEKKFCGSEPQYELCAIVAHSGTATAGHYVAYLKSNRRWYNVNDSLVAEISQKAIFSMTGENNVTPYLLLYRKISCVDEPNDQLAKEEAQTLVQKVKADYDAYMKEYIYKLRVFRQDRSIMTLSYQKYEVLEYILNIPYYLIELDGEVMAEKQCFTRFYAMSEFQGEISIYEAENGDSVILDLFVPGVTYSNLVRYFKTASPCISSQTCADMRGYLESLGIEVLLQQYNVYAYTGKEFDLVPEACLKGRVIVEFVTKTPDSIKRPGTRSIFNEATDEYYIYSIRAYEGLLKEYTTIYFIPFSDTYLSSNLSRTSDRILQLSFGDLKEAVVGNFLRARGFEIENLQINKLPQFQTTARFTDDFSSILAFYWKKLMSFQLITLGGGRDVTVQYFVRMFTDTTQTEDPDVLVVYNDIHFNGKAIFKAAGLNFLAYQDKTLRDTLYKPLTKIENSSFFEPIGDNAIQCSMLMEFGYVSTPQFRQKTESNNYHAGVLQFHYRVPLFDSRKMTSLRPYRAVIVFNSQPICDYYVHLQRAIDAVTVADFYYKMQERLYDFLNYLLHKTGAKHELIFSTQTLKGEISHILDDPSCNISEFRGYPMDQNLVFRIDVVQYGQYRFINRLNAAQQVHSFPFCVNSAFSLDEELAAYFYRHKAHLERLTSREYILLFYHYFRQRIYATSYCTDYSIVEKDGAVLGVKCEGQKAIKDIELFKGQENLEFV